MAEEPKKVVCPDCGHENEAGATRCASPGCKYPLQVDFDLSRVAAIHKREREKTPGAKKSWFEEMFG